MIYAITWRKTLPLLKIVVRESIANEVQSWLDTARRTASDFTLVAIWAFDGWSLLSPVTDVILRIVLNIDVVLNNKTSFTINLSAACCAVVRVPSDDCSVEQRRLICLNKSVKKLNSFLLMIILFFWNIYNFKR